MTIFEQFARQFKTVSLDGFEIPTLSFIAEELDISGLSPPLHTEDVAAYFNSTNFIFKGPKALYGTVGGNEAVILVTEMSVNDQDGLVYATAGMIVYRGSDWLTYSGRPEPVRMMAVAHEYLKAVAA